MFVNNKIIQIILARCSKLSSAGNMVPKKEPSRTSKTNNSSPISASTIIHPLHEQDSIQLTRILPFTVYRFNSIILCARVTCRGGWEIFLDQRVRLRGASRACKCLPHLQVNTTAPPTLAVAQPSNFLKVNVLQ